MIEKISNFVKELNASNSSNAKQQVILKYFTENDQDFLDCMHDIYSPYETFGITSRQIEKYPDLICEDSNIPDSLSQVLRLLAHREVTGHDAIRVVNGFISHNSDYRELILNAIDKDLKVRIGATLINKALKFKFIPVFSVALCEKYRDHADGVSFEGGDWYASRKLDGCRCIVRKEKGVVTIRSRQGKEFDTLDVIKHEFEQCYFDDFVVDGEICLIDENGDEDFQSIMKEIKRKNHTIANPHYKIFDILDVIDFDNGNSVDTFATRQNTLRGFMNYNTDILVHCSINKQVQLHSKEDFEEQLRVARDNNWEGIVIRKNVIYEGERTRNMLKCKDFFDAEYKVLDVIIGPFQVIEEGTAVEREVVSNVIIEHKGYKVSVGSGFSLDQRMYYKDHLDELIGKTITVQYFEETTNQQGDISLRFPVVKHIYDNGRDV